MQHNFICIHNTWHGYICIHTYICSHIHRINLFRYKIWHIYKFICMYSQILTVISWMYCNRTIISIIWILNNNCLRILLFNIIITVYIFLNIFWQNCITCTFFYCSINIFIIIPQWNNYYFLFFSLFIFSEQSIKHIPIFCLIHHKYCSFMVYILFSYRISCLSYTIDLFLIINIILICITKLIKYNPIILKKLFLPVIKWIIM